MPQQQTFTDVQPIEQTFSDVQPLVQPIPGDVSGSRQVVSPTPLVDMKAGPNPYKEAYNRVTGPIDMVLDALGGKKLGEFEQKHPTFGPSMRTASGVAGVAPAAGNIFENLAVDLPKGAVPSVSATKTWQRINEAIGATKKSIRIPKSATDIEQAVTMPARGLAREGFDAKTLTKMNPIEQQSAIFPKWRQAGQAIDKAAIDATAKNITLNPSKSALEVASSIPNPQLQEKAVQQLSELMKQVGIQDASKATPLETLQLRRALQASARFGPNGDLNSLGSIRARLYGAVSGDLKSAVPGFARLDQHYSDLNSAMSAINSSASNYLKTAPPTFLEKYGPSLAKTGIPVTAVGALYELFKHLRGE